jgi:GT2 family glycosyltransferase/glycosyltransferase involved in cell wall biosynthesis
MFLGRIRGVLAPRTGGRPGIVDQAFYFRIYPDVAKSGVDAATHYNEHGWKEGRNPSALFSSTYYAVRHLPGGKLNENPLAHFLFSGGEAAGLATMPDTAADWIALQKQIVRKYFNDTYYRTHYGDRLGDLAPLDHYFAVGWEIGCNPSVHFDTRSYLVAHAFIAQSNVNPLFHQVVLGKAPAEPVKKETSVDLTHALTRSEMLRSIAEHFDAEYYKSEYADVARAGISPLLHFVNHGWREGRNPSATFHTEYYKARYFEEIGRDDNPVYHYAKIGLARGYRTNPVGTELWPHPAAPSEADWGRAFSAMDEDADVNVIIPVYRGHDDTLATIFSVLTNPQKIRFHLTVINDASPDPDLTAALRRLAGLSLFTYLENDQNLGFIGTINKGLKVFPDRDVILLNADTQVFGDWIDRLMDHARRDEKVGTITPYSNNATICSYPDRMGPNPVALECSLAELDRYASICNKGRSTIVPTGVGFCFYIRRALIEKIGELDVDVGRGYGEESDFCMRAFKAGYKNIIAEDVFVFHTGRVSFFEFFDQETEQGDHLLISKHPDYARRVSAFSHSDPGIRSRSRLDLFRLARSAGNRSVLLVTMNGAGGVVTHVDAMAERFEASGINVLVAKVSGDSVTIGRYDQACDIYTPSLQPINVTFERDLFEEFIEWLQPEFIHLHSLAMASWRAAQSLMQALGRFSGRLYVTIHDYDPLCFRHNLVNTEGLYCGVGNLKDCKTCLAASAHPNSFDPATRRADWHAFLQMARRVFVPSADIRRRLMVAFPDVMFLLREHEEQLDTVTALTSPVENEPVRLVAIGAIGPHKGGDVIYSLALDAKTRKLPLEFHVAGYTAIEADMKAVGVATTGRYFSLDECIERVKEIRPAYALLLSIVPETYCYTLSIALALGLPPIVFDLGAQAERVRASGFGVILDPALALEPKALNDAILRLSVEAEWGKVRPVEFRSYGNFPTDYYELGE